MRQTLLSQWRTPQGTAHLALAAGLFAIGGAWFIQLVLGVQPCPLCLEQRIAYYAGLPIALIALVLARKAGNAGLARLLLAIVAAIFLFNAGFGGYHAGVEWGLWQGPTDCTGPISAPVGMQDFMKQLDTVKVVRCDAVAMRIFGLSLAAWNAVVSLGIALVAGMGAAGRSAQGSSSVSQ